MNIAHLLPYSAQFPLRQHNGRYEWALRLASLQAAQGHHVTIYCAPHSTDDSAVVFRSVAASTGDKRSNNVALLESALRNPAHDIFHSHFDSLHYEVAHLTQKPIVVTQHWFPNKKIADVAIANQSNNVVAVPVTHFMRNMDQKLGIECDETIYHGIDLSLFSTTNERPSDRYIFVGRITPQKGVYEVVSTLSKLGKKVDIYGKVKPKDEEYWQTILPFIDGENIVYHGAKPQHEIAAAFQSAKAMIFMPNDLEAFGQTIIEAQACGCPVIANDLGANNELIIEGKTGFIVHTPAELEKAMNGVSTIERNDCRAFAEQFNIDRMVESYQALYDRLVG